MYALPSVYKASETWKKLSVNSNIHFLRVEMAIIESALVLWFKLQSDDRNLCFLYFRPISARVGGFFVCERRCVCVRECAEYLSKLKCWRVVMLSHFIPSLSASLPLQRVCTHLTVKCTPLSNRTYCVHNKVFYASPPKTSTILCTFQFWFSPFFVLFRGFRN